MTTRHGLGRHGRLSGLLRAVALQTGTGLAGRVRSGAVRSGAGLALTLLAGLLRPGSGRAGVLTGWRDGRLHRLAGHRLAGELLARLRRARAAVGWSALLRVGLVAGPALLARVWWTLLTLPARPRRVLAAAVLLPRTLLPRTLLPRTLLPRTLLPRTLPSRPLQA